jgi:hypothetical protein
MDLVQLADNSDATASVTIATSTLNLRQQRVEGEERMEKGDEEDEVTEEAGDQMRDTDWEDEDIDVFKIDQRFTGGDMEAERQRALELLNSYESQPFNDSPVIADSTAIFRDRVMEAWNM